ncbi:MAG TPA: hypothetical protein VGQ35_17940 [Dongiaceae bacterium]|nr:hypothetical protein [Dongiaceae bacterium]
MLRYLVIGIVILVAFVLLRRLFGRRPTEPVGQQPPKMLTVDSGAVAAEIDGQELDIDPDVLAGIRKLVDDGQIINAIKLLRDATGLSLEDAKRIVESLERMKK